MSDSLFSQIKILLIFNITGLLIGFLFDFFRIQRKVIKTNDFITYVQDILFWIMSGIIVIISMVKFTDGGIRSYMILGIIVGIVLYFVFISKYIMAVSLNIVRFFTKILSFLVYPLKKFHEIIKKGWKKKYNML